jgi:hypothetical protein
MENKGFDNLTTDLIRFNVPISGIEQEEEYQF